jgi:hypothetical protein
MIGKQFQFDKIFIICQLVISFILFLSGQESFAQQKTLTVKTPTLSAGAEYSQFLEKQKLLGNAKALEFNGVISQLQKPSNIAAITTYEGINFSNDALNSGYYHIPPDPIGAVGPNYFVSVTNTSIEWFSKSTGARLNSQRLGMNATNAAGSFFESLSPETGTFDPKVIYDQYNGRFVVTALETTTSPNKSKIFIAVSKSSDPTAGWWFTSINSAITIGTLSYVDFPGLAVSSTGIYITANMFSFSTGNYTGGRLWIINKTQLYSGGTATWIVRDAITAGGGYSATYQPTQMFDNAQSGVGTFLVLYSGLSDGTNEYVNVIRVSNSLTDPTFSGQDVFLGDIDNTGGSYLDAPQQGTSTLINTNDRRTQNAVWRNNALWTAFTVVPNSGADAGQVTAHWVKINTDILSALSVADQGNIGGEDIATGTYTFFPSISVNSTGDAIIGFAASGPGIYPGAYYAGRNSSTPAGTILASQVVRTGLDYYVRQFGGTRNRWGDYSGSCVDPSDDLTFYIFNQYALTRGDILTAYPTEDGRWGTAWGVVPTSALPVELTNFSSVVNNGIVNLSWQTATEINNYGFDVERSVVGDQDQPFKKIGFIPGAGNSNSPKNYSFRDQPTEGTSFSYRIKQIDKDGNSKYYDAITVTLASKQTAELMDNYPNPFNPSTTIKFYIPNISDVSIKIYDMLGKEVTTLFNKQTEAGYHIVYWNGKDNYGNSAASGVYIYKLTAGNFSETKKMALLK